MKIAVLGSGNVGTALGDGWSAKGHQVIYGSRSPDKEPGKNRKFASIADAIAQSEVVVLAVPWDAVEPVLSSNNLSGKLLIDCTNPITPSFELAVGTTTSAGETVARLAKGARVVKAFNTTGFGNMRNPKYGAVNLTMFYAGDDAAAKAVANQLINDIGFDPVDAGPLKIARYLEPLAMLWINLSTTMGRDIALQLLKR
ncbi:MAG: NADPH-dependent F420 reductase [Candidatus Korobacteraceae bacterium]